MSPYQTIGSLLLGLSLTALTVGACHHTGERLVEPAGGGGAPDHSPALDGDAAILGPIADDETQPNAGPPTALPSIGLPLEGRVASRAASSRIGPGGSGGMPGGAGGLPGKSGGGGMGPSPKQIGLR